MFDEPLFRKVELVFLGHADGSHSTHETHGFFSRVVESVNAGPAYFKNALPLHVRFIFWIIFKDLDEMGDHRHGRIYSV